MIEVIVKGTTISGKSTVSAIIEKALTESGIKCHVNDQDGKIAYAHVVLNLEERLQTFPAKCPEVIINQEQVSRSFA